MTGQPDQPMKKLKAWKAMESHGKVRVDGIPN